MFRKKNNIKQKTSDFQTKQFFFSTYRALVAVLSPVPSSLLRALAFTCAAFARSVARADGSAARRNARVCGLLTGAVRARPSLKTDAFAALALAVIRPAAQQSLVAFAREVVAFAVSAVDYLVGNGMGY